MIEQHIYIKTGIGLETHSKSSGISNEFTDSFIRPLYSSLDLFYLEGKDSPGYKCMIPLQNGSLLIGSGVRLDKEPYSFIHNYIVSPDEADRIVSSPAALLSFPDSNIFASNHLSTLHEFPDISTNSAFLDKYFKSLNMASAEYMALLAAIFASVEQNRKVFIALPRNTTLTEICAIMFGLYKNLPYFIRQKTGFCTLYGETEIRPEINVYFVPEDKVIPGRDAFYIESYNATKDFVFNFASRGRSHISDLKAELSEEYLTYVASAYELGSSLSHFFEYAFEAGENLPYERKLSLRFYNDLTFIYNLQQNEESLPQKIGRVTIIFAEILRSGEKPHILSSYSEFIKLYRRYIKQRGILIPPEILKRLVLTYDFCPEQQKDELYDLITLDIDACLKDSESELLFMHIDATKGSNELYNKIVENKMAKSNRLIKRYFTYLIEQKKTVHSVMEFADGIFSEMPQITDHDIIRTMLCQRAMELYNTSGDRFEAVKYLEEKCLTLVNRYPDSAELFSSIYRYALENYMTTLEISELNCAKIEKFPLTDGESINSECTVKHKIALAAKEILALTDDVAMSFIHYDAFGFENIRANFEESCDDGKHAEEQLKQLLLRCIKEKKDAPRRIIYIILFYIYDQKDSKIPVDFDSIFEFMYKEMNIPPFEFAQWFLSSSLFIAPMTKNGRKIREASGLRADLTILTAFYEALRKHFLKHNELLANDRNMKKLKKEMDAASMMHPDFRELTAEFKKVMSGLINENHTPFQRLKKRIVSAKNFKFIILVAGILSVLVGGIAIGGLFSATEKSEVLNTLENIESKKIFIDKTGWASYKVTSDGNYLPSVNAIDGTDAAEIIDFAKDRSVMVSLSETDGLVINGLSISSVFSEEKTTPDVYVYTNEGKKLSVGVSGYDITTGSSLYAFEKPMCIKRIEICPKGESGTLTLKEVSAYIVK